MSREILDCLKGERDICIQNIILSQNTALKWTPALTAKTMQTNMSTSTDLDMQDQFAKPCEQRCSTQKSTLP